MRIGIFGNTNNVPFSIALGLRSLGVDVRLVVNRKYILHRPESKCPEYKQNYPDWIMDCSDVDEDDFVSASPRIHQVISFLNHRSDALVLNDIGPSLREYCDLPSISLLTGSDITYSANFNTIELRKTGCTPEFLISEGCKFISKRWTDYIRRQRNGIASSIAIHAAAPGTVAEIDNILKEIGIQNGSRIWNYLSTIVNVEPVQLPKNKRLRILNGVRLNWVKPMPPGFCSMDDKGTDILIRGFKNFIDLGNEAELVLIRKGLHVKETEELVNQCGISSNVIWLDEMSISDFHEEIKKADVVCDQFGSTTPGLVAMDAMAMGKPVIANFHLDILQQYYQDLDFVCDAQDADDIAKHFEKINTDYAYRLKLGDSSLRFVQKNCSPVAVAKIYLDRFGF